MSLSAFVRDSYAIIVSSIAADDSIDANATVDGALIEMSVIGLRDRLTRCKSAQQGDGGVGEITEASHRPSPRRPGTAAPPAG